MASQATGIEPILEINAPDDINIVIAGPDRNSVGNYGAVSSISIEADEFDVKIRDTEFMSAKGWLDRDTVPLFFEQTTYSICIISPKGQATICDDNDVPLEGLTKAKNNTQFGQKNFGSSIGYSTFTVYLDGRKIVRFTIEVFPSKIRYKEDYLALRRDLINEIYNLIFDFIDVTHQNFSTGKTTNSSLAEYYSILKKIAENLVKSIDRILRQPHHVLVKTHEMVATHKVKTVDNATIKWITNHYSTTYDSNHRIIAQKLPACKKQLTYDVPENQFVKFIINKIIKKISLIKSKLNTDNYGKEQVFKQLTKINTELNARLHNTFLAEVGQMKNAQISSLVFNMAPGYRELYKNYLLLSHGLNIQGDPFNIPLKKLSQLYEYWCFVKMYSMLKEYYPISNQSLITADRNGLSVKLFTGDQQQIVMSKNEGDQIILTYNKAYKGLPTVDQKPDTVLKITKTDHKSFNIQYIFDAKYRIDMAEKGSNYSNVYKEPGPVEDTINTMHRYRDAIVNDEDNPRYRIMVGAFVLFPYSEEEEKFRRHHFYKSIDAVNIGAIPFLPEKTTLMKELLDTILEKRVGFDSHLKVHEFMIDYDTSR